MYCALQERIGPTCSSNMQYVDDNSPQLFIPMKARRSQIKETMGDACIREVQCIGMHSNEFFVSVADIRMVSTVYSLERVGSSRWISDGAGCKRGCTSQAISFFSVDAEVRKEKHDVLFLRILG